MADYPEIRLFIDGKWRSSSESEPVLDPATEAEIGRYPIASKDDLADAVAAARRGFAVWRAVSPLERQGVMMRAAQILRDRASEIAHALTLEQGKPLEQSRLEVLRACDIIEWDATEGRRLYGRHIPAEPGMTHIVYREPIGVVAAFSPWNFPISSPARKVAGALASGCSIILKASEETPAGAQLLVDAFAQAGLPGGVLNLVFGHPAEISAHLISEPDVRLVTFTGSVPVGKALAALCGTHMKPSIMELGGHCPVIVAGDVDPEWAGHAAAISKSRNAGQVCVAPTRFYVHRSVHQPFVAAFARHLEAMSMGPGLDPTAEVGPLANIRRLEAMQLLVDDAVAQGARLVTGGQRRGNSGYFYPMTILDDVPQSARVMSEEPFGPIAVVQPYDDLADALRRANGLSFGLSAYGFTHDADTAAQMAAHLECGNLSINHYVSSVAETPFGGVKDSGYGREGGIEGLHCYTTVKNVSHLTRPLSLAGTVS
ncbi:NAD-dependent succinate-semialdehyde dehydrogenase [Paracoccus sp. (in: a-proteobacteria)]|uniref:NAD-dependent succinate-semialdehyde dehydrogenase n=1 Tax=Paracoccus sp. TaxID=267 RepID=UPI0028AE31DF|nr:NAD-dependent succinate-semialdehyde dehydrogenase [Paracoccus sp. (in: a-proteobacteria)]